MAKTLSYLVLASLVGTFAQGDVITPDQIKDKGYETERLLKIGAIKIYDPEEAARIAEAEELEAKTPREIELEIQLAEQKEALEQQQQAHAELLERVAALEKPAA